MDHANLISVIIPTYRRPQLVLRAVAGALAQTLTHLEVVVVVDGPDPATETVLATVDDPRFRLLILPQNLGQAGARNAGVRAARGEWVAFLDDDDEWLPRKLECQLPVALASQHAHPLVVSRFINRTEGSQFIWPRRLPQPGELPSDYLFVRHSFFQGEGALLTSTFFTRRQLLLEFPFESGKHEEYDWLLRVVAQGPGVGIDYVDEPLVVWHSHSGVGQTRLSKIPGWRDSLAWVQSARPLMTRRAYSSFVMTNVASPAAEQRDWPAFWLLLREAVQFGQPRPLDFALYLAMWLVAGPQRERLRTLLAERRLGSVVNAPQRQIPHP